jgi:hypothetical protein
MKAQATVFIILGVIFLAVMALIFTFVSKPEVESPMPTGQKAVSNYIDDCLASTARQGLLTIGERGGYYDVPDRSLGLEFTDVPYYYYMDDISLVATPNMMLTELSKYVENHIYECLNVTNEYEIQSDSPVISARLGTGKLYVTMFMPTKITRDGVTMTIDSFETEVPCRLMEVYNITNQIVSGIVADPYFVDLGNLLRIEKENGFQIDTMTFGEDAIVYIIQDEKTMLNGVPFTLLFGSLVDRFNHPAQLWLPDTLEMEIGAPYNYRVRAADKESRLLHFSTDSPFFVLNEYSGEIEFVPRPADYGEHHVNISVFDGYDTTTKKVKVVVK